jgi:hypothetical protein
MATNWLLAPVRHERPVDDGYDELGERIQTHFEEHGITESDIEDAIESARREQSSIPTC